MENKDQISKWLNNELNSRELEEFKKTADYHRYKAIVENASKFQKPAFDEQESLQLLKKKMANTEEPKVRKLNFSGYYKIAAVLVIAIASGLLFLLNAPKTVSTGYSETAMLELPDASKVQLNADSEIKYKPRKWEKNRNLSLRGEAFFEVSKGEKFSVETDQGRVSVLGTKFNIKSRPEYFEVHCYEGAVKVSHSGKEIILKKGKYFKVVNGETENVSNFTNTAPGWIFKESNFNAVPLKEVIAELERQFDIKIEAKDIDLDQGFTGSFSHTDKEIALKSVVIPLQLKYAIKNERKVIFYEE